MIVTVKCTRSSAFRLSVAAGVAVPLLLAAGPVEALQVPTPDASQTSWLARSVLAATSQLPTAAAGQQKPMVNPVVYVTSPWFGQVRYIGINYGCNKLPYYPPDSRCPGHQGFHHGVDIAMPTGTPITSAVAGRAVLGGLGTAYGSRAFRIRTANRDIVLGHVSRVLVRSGQRVKPGDVVAYSGALGAPDGAHLHFEVRPVGGAYTQAKNPMAQLRAQVVAIR